MNKLIIKKITKLLLGISLFSYISVRLGFFGTNILTLKDDADIRYICIINDNRIFFNVYRYWNNDLEMEVPYYKYYGFSIRPLVIEHFDEKNIETKYKSD